ncbi:MAG: META domain-containing protein [Candidatus Limnocylindrales bacterium]
MRRRILALAAVSLVAISGCNAIGAAQGGQLDGLAWQLSTYLAGGAAVPVPDEVAATATFAEGQVSGSNGCNGYSGPYVASGSTLTIGPLASTLMGCGPVQSALETTFMTLFQQTGSYTATSTELSLYDTSGAKTMTFTPQAAVTLESTPWNVVSYNNGNEATVSLVIDSTITLLFGSDGTVSGNATCNSYNGTFTADAAILKVGPLATTRMACVSDELNAQEAQYLAALQSAATYDITNGTLTIRDADGASQVIATPLAAQP